MSVFIAVEPNAVTIHYRIYLLEVIQKLWICFHQMVKNLPERKMGVHI